MNIDSQHDLLECDVFDAPFLGVAVCRRSSDVHVVGYLK